jgi:hypothetical protein
MQDSERIQAFAFSTWIPDQLLIFILSVGNDKMLFNPLNYLKNILN